MKDRSGRAAHKTRMMTKLEYEMWLYDLALQIRNLRSHCLEELMNEAHRNGYAELQRARQDPRWRAFEASLRDSPQLAHMIQDILLEQGLDRLLEEEE